MKNLKSLRPAILIVAAIVMLSAGCSKNKSDFVDNTAKAKIQLRDIDPVDQKFGAVKGLVIPANAVIALYNDSFTARVVTDPNTGSFAIENVPAGIYTLDAWSLDPRYGSVQFDVIVTAGNTTALNITLPKQ